MTPALPARRASRRRFSRWQREVRAADGFDVVSAGRAGRHPGRQPQRLSRPSPRRRPRRDLRRRHAGQRPAGRRRERRLRTASGCRPNFALSRVGYVLTDQDQGLSREPRPSRSRGGPDHRLARRQQEADLCPALGRRGARRHLFQLAGLAELHRSRQGSAAQEISRSRSSSPASPCRCRLNAVGQPLAWSVAGLLAAVALPWYALQEGLDSGAWLAGLWSSEDYAAGLGQLVAHGKWWLAPVLVALAGVRRDLSAAARRANGAAPCCCWRAASASSCSSPRRSASACAAGARTGSTPLFGELDGRQVGIGAGAALVLIALLSLLSIGLALRGAFGGDAFVAGAITTVAASILLFTAWPILRILAAGLPGRRRRLHAGPADRTAGGGEDLEPALPRRRRPLRRGVEHAVPGAVLRRRHDGAGPGLRPDRHAHRLPLQEDAARADGAADHHAALRDRPGADPGVRPLRPGEPVPRLGVRRAADALDLRLPGRVAGAALRLHAGRLPGADRRRRGRQPDARGGLADPARRPLGRPSPRCRCR